jgi:hypothetical protein
MKPGKKITCLASSFYTLSGVLINEMKLHHLLIFLIISTLSSCRSDEAIDEIPDVRLQLQSARVGIKSLSKDTVANMPINQPIVATFSHPLNRQTVVPHFALFDNQNQPIELAFSYLDQDKTVSALPAGGLKLNTIYTLDIGSVESVDGAIFPGATFQFKTMPGEVALQALTIDGISMVQAGRVKDVPLSPVIKAIFSHPILLDENTNNIRLEYKGNRMPITVEMEDEGRTIIVTPEEELGGLAGYNFIISNALTTIDERTFQGFSKIFYTHLDSTLKFPEISDEELLTLVQQQTFRYFWDFAHPASGMARERNTSGNLVTSGGSGFGIMAIIAGIERGFISRNEGISHLGKIIGFLETANRFHGAWPHWINGNTGAVIPFSQKDNGGDLVETSFLIQGLITFRQYLDANVAGEKNLIDRINTLWRDVEWNWYTKGENVLYWHWSPNYGWEMNLPVRGWNESLITYVLAAGSPTHPIDAQVYHQGWARNGNMRNGSEFYGIKLPLGYNYGGPLFFSHYSFLGLDPRKLKDQYANYWEQNVSHALINWHHAVVNPNHYVGYSEHIWGITASDNQNGYSAHSPTNDLGVITPTAAISSIPYTPEKSMDAIRTFYYFLGDRLWGPYGFYDAFNPTANWYADSYLAIDQGPIVVMIENYRSGLLWELFMSAPEVQTGLTKLGFTY